MANPNSETTNGLNADPNHEPEQLGDDELETVSGGLAPGAGATSDGGVCVSNA